MKIEDCGVFKTGSHQKRDLSKLWLRISKLMDHVFCWCFTVCCKHSANLCNLNTLNTADFSAFEFPYCAHAFTFKAWHVHNTNYKKIRTQEKSAVPGLYNHTRGVYSNKRELSSSVRLTSICSCNSRGRRLQDVAVC